MINSSYVHPTAIIDSGVILGENNYIGPYCYITGNTQIGDNNRFEAYCSIGTPPEHRDHFKGSPFSVVIGNNCIIREYVTINSGTIRNTILHDSITMLRNSHIGHDSIIESKVNLSCNVLIGGHSHVMEGANLGLGSMCHQFSVIGAYSMIGMGGIVVKSSEIHPGEIYVGNPVKFLKENKIGLHRNKITSEKLSELVNKYFSLSNK
jgi:UDP-N-acetylglucosamine acyltransferase